jgi:hypothetical protein
MKNSISTIFTVSGRGMIAFIAVTLFSCTAFELGDKPSNPKTRNWETERKEREQLQAAYIEDAVIKKIPTDGPTRTPWYSNKLAYQRYSSSPIAFNGVPYVLLRAVIEIYPEIWKGEGSLGNLGFGPHPDDYDPATGKLLPKELRHPLPYGFFTAQGPDAKTENVFFSCAACHTGRVYVKGRVRHLIGAPNTEIEAQEYAHLIYLTGEKLKGRDEIQRVVSFLRDKVERDPAWFYGGRTPTERSANIERAKAQVRNLLEKGPEAAISDLMKIAGKTERMYGMASKFSYIEKDGQKAPDLYNSRPGRMDAFGISAGLVALHAAYYISPDYDPTLPGFLLERLPDDHPFFSGFEKLPREEKFKRAAKRLVETAPDWMPHQPAASDIMSLWLSGENVFANWDGNQGVDMRVIASGVSAGGVPSKVNSAHLEAMNPFINELPPAPYPFTVDLGLAAKGQPLFEKSCMNCHRPANKEIYNVGTDMNRAEQISFTARRGLVELTRQTCELYVEKGGSDWCRPKRLTRIEDDEAYFTPPRGNKSGYKATPLHGIWASAPYLHNGSVPTLWHLLRPADRPLKFIRGNIKYDEMNVGFVWDKKPGLDEYGPDDAVHFAEYDTTLRGNSNAGHPYGDEWSNDQVRAVIEYMKTL